MNLADRLRRAAAGLGQAFSGRRPGVELVRVDRPELLAPPAPRPLPALPPPQWPLCRSCGGRHAPAPRPSPYGRTLDPADDPYGSRPRPLSHQLGDTASVRRDRFSPWTPNPAAEPIPPGTSFRERVAHLWHGDQPDP